MDVIIFPLPTVDGALVIASLLAFFVTLALALVVRPELRNGKKLSRMTSYVIGAGILLASIVALQTYRDLDPQLWLDVALLAAATGLAAATHRVLFGEPRRGNPHRDLRKLEMEAKELTNGIDNDGE